MRTRWLPPVLILLAIPVLAAPTPRQAKEAVGVLRYDNLGRALAAMMTSDLSVLDEIQIVERERLEAVVVETSKIVKTAEVTGQTNEIFDSQQRLADELLDGLALVLTKEDRDRLRAPQEANHIDDLETAMAFFRGPLPPGPRRLRDAFEQIQEVRQAAPGSRIVQVPLDRLKDGVGDEAKHQLVEPAGRKLGGLLGGNRTPQRPARPAGC